MRIGLPGYGGLESKRDRESDRRGEETRDNGKSREQHFKYGENDEEDEGQESRVF